ncbi:MAG: helix-turn-helix domain-containing protein [Anaerolineae bacterium]|nr:helix-turn-helix domain-containing protein [Anaerolineae bacterium]
MVSQLKRIVLERSAAEGRRITNRQIAMETGLLDNTISRWMSEEPFDKINSQVAVKLCVWAKCELGELLALQPMQEQSPN